MNILLSLKHWRDRNAGRRYIMEQSHKIKHKALANAHSIAIREDFDEKVVVEGANEIKHAFQVVLLYVLQQFEAGQRYTNIEQEDRKAQKRIAENEKKIKKLENKRELLLTDIRRIRTTYDWPWYMVKLALIVLVCAGEIAINTSSFAILGESLIFNVVASCAFSICIALGAHYLPKLADMAESRKGKIRMSVLIGMAACVVFLFIGWLRAKAVQHIAPQELTGDNFWLTIGAFAAINLFMFIILCVTSHLGLPTKDQKVDRWNLQKLTKELKEVNRDVSMVENDSHKVSEVLETLRKQQEAKQSLEELIESLTASVILEYTNEVHLKRNPLNNLDNKSLTS